MRVPRVLFTYQISERLDVAPGGSLCELPTCVRKSCRWRRLLCRHRRCPEQLRPFPVEEKQQSLKRQLPGRAQFRPRQQRSWWAGQSLAICHELGTRKTESWLGLSKRRMHVQVSLCASRLFSVMSDHVYDHDDEPYQPDKSTADSDSNGGGWVKGVVCSYW